MATHSSVLAWRIPGMGEPGGLPSMGSHKVGNDEGTAQWRLKLCKGAESLHDKECSGRPLEAEGDPLTATAEDGPL